METTAAGESAFLCSLAVVVVPFLNWLSGHHLKSREWIGAALAMAGVAMLELGGGGGGSTAVDVTTTAAMVTNMDAFDATATAASQLLDIVDATLLDDAMASISSSTAVVTATSSTIWTYGRMASMIQPLAFGMGFWRMERAMQKYPTHVNRSTAAQLLAALLGSALYCAVAETNIFHDWLGIILGDGENMVTPATCWSWEQLQSWLSDPTILAFIAWTGIASTALSVYMETRALKTLSAAETTLILSTEPIWGAAFAAVVIGEQFGVDAAMGGCLILLGCLYSNLGVDGIQKLFKSASQNKSSPNEHDKDTSIFTSPREAASQSRHLVNTASSMSIVGTTSAILGASLVEAWNSLSIGARVTILQIRDVLEDFSA
uniref:EamA domain-containing protein n=2 Tax=Entomoneis paludosa TaxID=265537 RepID=A0A7S2Y943_9STRA